MKYTILFLFIPCFGYSQNLEGLEVPLYKKSSATIEFYSYPKEKSKFYLDLKDSSQVSRKYPEGLMLNMYSANNQDWINSLYFDMKPTAAKQEVLNEISTRKRDSTYMLFSSKLVFEIQGKKYCCFKYYLKMEGKKLATGTNSMVFEGGKWYVSGSSVTSEVSLILWLLDQKSVNEIFSIKKSQNKVVSTIISQVYENGKLKIENFGKAISSISKDSPDFQAIKDKNL